MSFCSLRNFYPEGYITTNYIVVVCIISQTFVRCKPFTAHKRAVKNVFIESFVERKSECYFISVVIYRLFFRF